MVSSLFLLLSEYFVSRGNLFIHSFTLHNLTISPMKLRLEANSLRLRLSEEEVDEFAQTGHLATVVQLAPGAAGQLTYALQRAPDNSTAAAPGLRVAYLPGRLTVLVPDLVARRWTASDEISLSTDLDSDETAELRILVEKDLDCKH